MRDRQGVTKVAFKLTKSSISQIRLWLFLRERKRGVVEGAGKNEVKQKETAEDVMREKEGSQSWGMTEETVRDKKTCKKGKKGTFERGGWARERRQKWSIWKVRAYFQQREHMSFSVGWSRHIRRSAWTRRHWEALNTSPAGFYHLCERRLEYTVAKYHQFLFSAWQSYARSSRVSLKCINDLGFSSYRMQSWT